MAAKKIFTVIAPDGSEQVLGAFANVGAAKRRLNHSLAPDYLACCCGPLEQREVREGETIIPGATWNPAVTE